MELLCIGLIIVGVASAFYWFRYHSGAFATDEQSAIFDAIDQDLEKHGL